MWPPQTVAIRRLETRGAERALIKDNDLTGVRHAIFNASKGIVSIKDNAGYNPVGPARIVKPPPSGGTYIGGSSPETIYVSSSGGISSLKHNGLPVLPPTGLGANVMGTFVLGPNESLSIIYSGSLTMTKMVH